MFAKHLALFAGLYMITWGLAVAIFGMDYGRLEVGIGVVAGGAWLLRLRDDLAKSYREALRGELETALYADDDTEEVQIGGF